MYLKELIRFSTQHRAFYCYLILSIWIFLLIAGMYKYIGNTNVNSINNYMMNGKRMYLSTAADDDSIKFKQYKQHCTPIESITRKDDGGILDGWKLQGVLLVIRHGDRGPMSHVRGIYKINCGIEGDILINRYKNFLINASNPSGTNHMYWNKVGPFHGFALLPSTQKSCLLGQLTYKGISQLLHIGEIMRQVYLRPLGLYMRPSSITNKLNINSTPHTLLNSDEVILYTTRYRRTFQSAMALMYAFLPHDKWLALNLRESHSMAFCFSDCACGQADVLRKKLNKISNENLSQHSAISAVVQWIGHSLLQHAPNSISTPHEVMDALLSLLCHDAPLPCKNWKTTKIKPPTEPPTPIDLTDFINIDQDEISLNSNTNTNNNPSITAAQLTNNIIKENNENDMNLLPGSGCIEQSHVLALMSFTNWESAKQSHYLAYKQIGLLRAYGLIRDIVSNMLKMMSGDKTKFVLYSGHDWTMQFLIAALGINIETAFIPYAARLAFEVYRSDTQIDYYFRVIYNGKDVTQQIDFCEGGKSLRITRDSRGNKADLCPIENIIRFIHDDYFSSLNATNFKDACTIQKPNEL